MDCQLQETAARVDIWLGARTLNDHRPCVSNLAMTSDE